MPEASGTVCLDSVIFGLQTHGGISNYWGRLLDQVAASGDPRFHNAIPQTVRFRGWKPEWALGERHDRSRLNPRVASWMGCRLRASDRVLHTSYYRLPARPVARYVVTVYDFMYERYRSGPARWLHATVKRRSLLRADVVSCISEFTRQEALELCPGLDPARLHAIPLGVDLQTFYPDRTPGPEADALARTVLFVGLRGGYKRFDLCLAALRARPTLTLGIIGPEPTAEERTGWNQVLEGRWRYLGAVPAAELRKAYSAALALIVSSDCEGFGLPVLEAMACGCPVVAARRASLPEVGGTAALYAEQQHPDDYAAALLRLEDAGSRQDVVRLGLAQAARFQWSTTISRTLSLYDEATA